MHYALKDYGANLKWSVGTLFCHDKVLDEIIDLCRKFGILHPIKWAFGCIPGPLSSAMALSSIHSELKAEEAIEHCLKRGIACRLALSNPHADSKMIAHDSRNRELMHILNEERIEGASNGVIVSSDMLAEHIRENHPNLEVILSCVRPAYDVGYGKLNDTLEWYSERLFNPLYDVVEVNNAKIHEEGFMEDLPCKDKVELIACRDCLRNCPFTKHHYEASLNVANQFHLFGYEKTKMLLDEVNEMCVAYRMKHWDQASSFCKEDICRLAKLGYERFQISSRRNTPDRVARDIKEYIFDYRHLRYFENLM